MLAKIKSRLRREGFQPTWLGMLVNPVYIARSQLFKAIQGFAPGIKGGVLDFGCGSKPYEGLFTNASRYVGCDIEVSGHDHRDSKVDYYFDGKTLPFENEKFDAVVSFEVFEHVFNLSDLLAEINRVTKKDGCLLLSVPFAWAEHEAPYDFARYTSFGMTHLLESNGYRVLELHKSGTYLLTVFQLGIAYLVQHIAPKNRLFYLFQFIFIFPLTLLAYCLNGIFPKRHELFLGSVILARKVNPIVDSDTTQ